ncbi:MAG: osmotically inducible protein OsmC [Pelagibacteraceae bacterium TMED287]|nr:MAG: osmotically inducible protein OsmC [Pelagibacteraceae bacterium TMED287]
MSKIKIDLFWKLKKGELSPGKYSNEHEISFTTEKKIIADSAPDWNGSSSNVNPEQTLAASLSSCHMMTFLALAAKMKWQVLSYKDKAIATLGKNSKGQMSVTQIELNPKIQFSTGFSVKEEEMKKVQDRAHRYCFIANSLSQEVKVLIN